MVQKRPVEYLTKKQVPRGARCLDRLAFFHKELFVVRNPSFRKRSFAASPEWKEFLKAMAGQDRWVYWPAEKVAIHMLTEKLYFELRTARNRNLITKEEQKAYRETKVGIAGLSVGSSIVSALALTGGPKVMKIADFDVLEPTNLNRIRAGLKDLGTEKIELAAREVWGVDPFARLYLWDKGLTDEGIRKFITGAPRLDIFIDEMDDLALKVAARLIAKKEKMPVLMATDNGDGVLVDVERFDLEPKRKIFHGVVGDLTVAQAREARGPQWFALASKIIGEKYMPPRHKASLKEIGKTLAGIPQLGTDALLAGAAISLAVRKIASGARLPSGKYMFNVNGAFLKPLTRK